MISVIKVGIIKTSPIPIKPRIAHIRTIWEVLLWSGNRKKMKKGQQRMKPAVWTQRVPHLSHAQPILISLLQQHMCSYPRERLTNQGGEESRENDCEEDQSCSCCVEIEEFPSTEG